uniref:Uncharacterized protein n=1 Tax=uncultured marine virus TaxID=186617 RepID=A0A0F7L6E0_9VIRU|nr:hypothetical protein [uncultured marine virus]
MAARRRRWRGSSTRPTIKTCFGSPRRPDRWRRRQRSSRRYQRQPSPRATSSITIRTNSRR